MKVSPKPRSRARAPVAITGKTRRRASKGVDLPATIKKLSQQDEWHETLQLANGRTVVLRPIEPEDAHALRAGFTLLSPEDVRFRFFHPMRELPEDLLRQLTELNPAQAFALVIAEPLPAGEALIGAVARVYRNETTGEGEFALLVANPLKGFGLGKYLLQKIIQWCRQQQWPAIYGDVHTDNTIMFRLAHGLGFEQSHVVGEPGIERVRMQLR